MLKIEESVVKWVKRELRRTAIAYKTIRFLVATLCRREVK
jgi:hypothetical protein